MSRIRPATRSDFERLREIQGRALAEPWPELLETAVGGYPPVYVAVDSGPVGYAITVPGPEGVAYLPELAVDPAHQREGHGSALISSVCEQLRADGYEKLRLSVLADDDAARQFYSDSGFEFVERLPAEFDSGDGILLAKDLGP